MYNYKMTDDRAFVPEHYEIFLKHIKESFVDDIFEDNNETEFLSFIDFNIISIESEVVISKLSSLF